MYKYKLALFCNVYHTTTVKYDRKSVKVDDR